ncbi:amidohydrolase family protein [Microvirga massiliensis]|uniref:amidohydrolase family protein n=1 Tax=Microvirga massiliensis TaxID=1033741 RepID=UPI00062BC56D|nr:amidohydrolase family protein [Microvirga massiliensis]
MDESRRAGALQIVDPHQHFWNIEQNYYPWLCDEPLIPFRYGDYSALRRNYLPIDYRTDWDGIEVLKTVHIEAEWDHRDPVGETIWIERLSAQEGLPTACVAQAWLGRGDVGEVLARQSERPLVRGIRQKPRAAASPSEARRGTPGSMDDPAWRRGFALLESHGLSFDLQTPWWHLDAAADLARDFPDTQIIINHTALPSDRSPEGRAGWRRALELCAPFDNVALKISGLGQVGRPWTVEANGPIVRDAISIFGVGRCMFASNYPVDRLAGSFAEIMQGFAEIVADLPAADQRRLFRENAERLYRL